MKPIKQILLVLLAAAFPALLQAQTLETFTFTTNRAIPDGNAAGLSDVQNVNSAIGNISSLQVHLTVAGEFNGDLYAYLRHSSGFAVLLNRAGRTASNPDGYGDSGVDVTFSASAANGDIHLYENLFTPVAGFPLTNLWDIDGRSIDPFSVTDSSSRNTSLTNFNGLNAVGQWTLFVADMESGGTNALTSWTLNISGGASPTLVWTNPTDVVYGTALSGAQLNASAIYNSTNVPGTFTYSSPSGTVLNAGSNQTLSVTFVPNDTNSFLTVSTNVAISVSTAPLTIAANSTNSVYGSTLPVLSASYTGFVNGDTTNSLTTQETLTTSATSASSVGAYTIVAAGATSANYAITHVNGTLNITPAALVITAVDKTKVYGAALPTLTASYGGFVNGDSFSNLTTQASLVTAATISSGVGNYSITASGAASGNYSISYVAGNLAVTPAAITVAADSKSKIYGAALPTLTATYTGFVLSQSTSDLTGLATVTTTATSTSGAGTYPITAIGASSSNYTFSYVDGVLTIGQAASTGLVSASPNPALPGANVTFTMAASAVAPGAGTPTGTVNFQIDGNPAGSSALSGGIATFSTTNLSHASHTVVAMYAGDSNFTGTTNSLAQSEVINTPPVAGNYTLFRNPAASAKVRLATLLTNASDADGDTLTITVGTNSASNGVVRVSGGWVFYTPPTGFTNADSYTYTVTDGHGDSATGTVAVTIQVDNNPSQNVAITDLGNGSVRIDGNGIPGFTYRLQYSDSTNPFVWQDAPSGSLTADSTGKFQYTDTGASGLRFYRTVYP